LGILDIIFRRISPSIGSPSPKENGPELWQRLIENRFSTRLSPVTTPSTHIMRDGDHITAFVIRTQSNRAPLVQVLQTLAVASETNRQVFMSYNLRMIDLMRYMNSRDQQQIVVDDIELLNNEVYIEIPEHLFGDI
jgi:hypothetical protein